MSLIVPPLLLAPVESGKERSWAEIHEIFSTAPVLSLGQSWQPEKCVGFQEGWVRAGRVGELVGIYAELPDEDIYNSSRSLNEKTWMTGDVFEIFLKSEAVPDYYEFHVTPENQKLQLHFPSVEAYRAKRPWGTHCLEGEVFFSKTLVEEGRWCVYAEVPLNLFQGSPWRFSFCRYDATRGREFPVVSSTSPYQLKNFHRLQDWGWMSFGEKAETLKC